MPNIDSLKTIPDFLDNAAKLFPQKTGLIFGAQRFGYDEIRTEANKISVFISEKTKKGEVVALLLSNIPEMIFGYFGILGAGRVVLLLPANVSDENLFVQVKKTKARFILSEEKYRPKINRINLKKVAYIDVKSLPNAKKFIFNKKIKEQDVSTVVFTSGSTGSAKGVKLRHFNVVNATKNIIEFLKWRESDVDVSILPLSHSFGLGNIHSVFAVGGEVILFRDTINMKEILQTIEKSKATTFSAVPTTLRLIMKDYPEEFKKSGNYLRFVQTNTSPLEPELIEGIIRALPKTDFNYYYGLTEGSRSTFITLNKNPDKLASVGQASPNVEIKIISDKGAVLPNGETGEVCLKGKHVVDGYWQNPKASRKIKNGWLYTGDVGFLDKEGYLYLSGRKDDIINIGGEKVSPEEIENVVKKLSGVKDAAAIGVSDRLLGEVVKLFVSVEDGNFKKDKIITECRSKLENYKQPKSVEIISEIPRTENGKVARFKLRNLN